MPSSNLVVAPAVLHYVWEVRPADRPIRVLDVGPGWGKYGVLVREYVDPAAEVRAVEAWDPYVTARLRAIYDDVVTADVTDAVTRPESGTGRTVLRLLEWADVVLAVDVLEHMPKADGLAVIDLVPGHLVFSTPRDFFDTGPGLPPSEAHVSHWTPDDFAATGRLHGYDADLYDRVGGIVGRLNPR